MPITITDISQLTRLSNPRASTDEILPDPWDDREKRLRAFHATQNIYKKNIANLSKILNKHHNVNFSIRYWSIVCGPWFRVFTNRLYHFWEYFESIEIGNTESIELPDFDLEDFVSNDQANFYEISRSESWNQLVIGQLAKRRGIKIDLANLESPRRDHNRLEREIGTRSKILRTINLFLDIFSRKIVLVTSSNLTNWQKFKLMISLRERLYFLEHEFSLPLFDYFLHQRRSLVEAVGELENIECEFEKILLELALLHMPKPFIEGFVECNNLSIQSRLPEKPSVILTGTAIYGNELFKIYSAAKIEKGCKLCIICHGGGDHLYTDFLEHELDICDRYFTWGWQHESPKCVKGFNIQLPKRDKITGKERSLLMIMTTSQDNTEFLESMPSKRQFRIDYVEDQIKFIQCLDETISSKLNVRLAEHRDSYVKDRISDFFPNLRYIFRGEQLERYKLEAKILIITYSETSLVEALASNKPTIVFFREEHWELNSNALGVYDRLRECGILHDTPESAAQHANNIWNDVEKWWSSSAVRSAVELYNIKFSRRSQSPVKELIEFVRF